MMYCACASKYSQLFAVHQLQHSYGLSASPSAPPIRRTKMGLLEKMMVAKLRPSVVPWLQRLDNRKQQKNKHVIKDKDTTDTQDATDTQCFGSVPLKRYESRSAKVTFAACIRACARAAQFQGALQTFQRAQEVMPCGGEKYWVPSGND